jgi:hypothetical protein
MECGINNPHGAARIADARRLGTHLLGSLATALPGLAQVPEFSPIPLGLARGEPQEPVQA